MSLPPNWCEKFPQKAVSSWVNSITTRLNCEQADRLLVITKYGRYPHTDDTVEVHRIFHKLRSISMADFNEQFSGIFDGQVPTKGLIVTQHFTLSDIFELIC